jgi:hypothetical protein
MTLLQITEKYSDGITVSSLPHPISTFFLGFTLFALLLLYVEYKRSIKDFKEIKEEFNNLKKKLDEYEFKFDNKLTDVSKKVDSRVDKAILSIKKQIEK